MTERTDGRSDGRTDGRMDARRRLGARLSMTRTTRRGSVSSASVSSASGMATTTTTMATAAKPHRGSADESDGRDERASSTSAASRKIAKLTRVVARLHAECEDKEDALETATRMYARDVALTRAEASDAVFRELRARDEAEGETRMAYAESARRRVMYECAGDEISRKANAEVSNAMEQMEIASQRARVEAENRIRSVKEECERAREETERARAEALRLETETRARIIENARTTERELSEALEFEKSERVREHREFEQEMEEMKVECEVRRAKVNADAESKIAAAASETKRKDEELSRYRREMEEELTRQQSNAHDKFERQRIAYDFLEKSLAETESDLECTRRAKEGIQNVADDLARKMQLCEEKLTFTEKSLTEATARTREAENECCALSTREADLTRLLEEAREAYASSILEKASLEDSIREFERATRGLENDIALMKRQHSDALDALRAEEQKLKLEMDASAKRQNALHVKLEERTRATERERAELIESYEARIRALEVEHKTLQSHADDRFQEEMIQRVEEGELAMAAAEESWLRKESEWLDIQRRLDARAESADSRQRELESIIDVNERQISALKRDVEAVKDEAKSKETSLKERLRDSALSLKAVETLVHKLEKELTERTLAHEEDKISAYNDCQRELTRLNGIWERKTRENVEEALERAHREAESDMEHFSRDLEEKTKIEVARTIADMSEVYRANEKELHEEMAALKTDFESSIAKQLGECEREARVQRMKHEEELARAHSTHVAEMERMKSANTELAERMAQDFERRIQESTAEAVEIAVLTADTKHSAELTCTVQQIEATKNDEMKRLREECDDEMQALERDYASKIDEYLQMSSALELEHGNLRDKLCVVSEKLGKSERERALETQKARDALKASVASHEAEIRRLRSEHKINVERLQNVNETAARVANDALAASRAETRKWRSMYEHREARPEDLKRISELEDDLKSANERLDRSAAHRRTLQAELLGRAAEFDSAIACSSEVGGFSARRARAAYANSPVTRR